MKKIDIINAICELQNNIPRTLLAKKVFTKSKLEDLYRRLINNEEYKECLSLDNLKKNVKKKKPVRIVEFSDSDEEVEDVEEKVEKVIEDKVEKVNEDKVENVIEDKVEKEVIDEDDELPSVMPLLVRQNANVPQKINKIKIKKEIKNMLVGFIRDVKDLLMEYKVNFDKDYLIDRYNLLLRDQEEIYQDYLENIEADDSMYNYVADLLSVHTAKIERIVN